MTNHITTKQVFTFKISFAKIQSRLLIRYKWCTKTKIKTSENCAKYYTISVMFVSCFRLVRGDDLNKTDQSIRCAVYV